MTTSIKFEKINDIFNCELTLSNDEKFIIPMCEDGYLHTTDFERKHVRESYTESYIDKVFYINLDYRTDRKEAIETELKEFGLPFERFSAKSHAFGAVGCSQSHLAVLKLARERKYHRVLILEDDFTFNVSKQIFENEMRTIHEYNKPYDVCMISYNVMKSEPTTEPFWKKIVDAQTMSGYLVNNHYYDTLIDLIEPSIPLLEQTREKRHHAVDIVIKLVQPRDKWYHTTTRIGLQRPSYSDIEQRNVDYQV